ncbi:ileal sodium/bile acid cotransporter-like isoform X2 [Choristoneura fumiferana]|uniref:ileal sodium/bile acid cotransporter-like isoform X2 n=1 Tax=Choristoneura fumiferana TaxID=7141 RepID=UPI003D15B85E
MCPIWPLHLIVLYILAICPLWVICQTVPQLTATFLPAQLTVNMDEYYDVNVTVTGTGMQLNDELILTSRDGHLAKPSWRGAYVLTEDNVASSRFDGVATITGSFLGLTEIRVAAKRGTVEHPVSGELPVTVLRPERIIDRVFVTSVALFVSLIFINFGCAMDWPTVKGVIKRPVGPAIGMLAQFLFMPLMSFALGFLIFPSGPEGDDVAAALRLGMFFTGVSPGGGASNIWTFVLGGNLNLSLAMTSISTLASFGFMPAWLFSLGQVVFRQANIVVPYARIASFVVGLLVPLAIGLGMQKWTPRLSAFLVRILKPLSTTLLLFIIVFAIITNLYIFELFTWQILVAGMGLPWLGYGFGYGIARIFRQPHVDALAISMETGVQNTGISIFLLRYALPQPQADLTTVVPVSVAIMTPVIPTCIFVVQKIMSCKMPGFIYKIVHKTFSFISI